MESSDLKINETDKIKKYDLIFFLYKIISRFNFLKKSEIMYQVIVPVVQTMVKVQQMKKLKNNR
jgi:hypothetical protein